MLIKEKRLEYPLVKFLIAWFLRFFGKKRIVLLALLFFAVFIFGGLSYRFLVNSGTADKIIKPMISRGYQWPLNYFKGIFFSEVEKITIDVNFDDYQKILRKRDEALRQHLLVNSDEDYVPAVITHNNKKFSADIRLKGDATDHIIGDKWSFRIKTKGSDALFGMTRFSIQDPERRNYLYERLFHQFLKKEGVSYLRYDFIDVTLNGKHLGIYALEEFFSEQTLANNRLPKGPILKFNEDFFFALVLRTHGTDAHVEDPRDEIYVSNPIDAFESSKIQSDSILFSQFQTAKNLLEALRSGVLTTSQVFNIEKLAKFYAIVDLTNAWHSTGWTNTRLYYNPATSLLEPIGYDAFTGEIDPITYLMGYSKPKDFEDSIYDLRYTLFKDMEFFEEYIKQLQRISQSGYLEEFLDEIDKELKNSLYTIWRDNPMYSFSTNVIYQNREYIRNALNPLVGIRAYLKVSAPKIIVEVANIQPLPVVFQGEILPGRIPNTPLVFQDFGLQELPKVLNYKILGIGAVYNAEVIPWTALDLNEIEQIKKRRTPNYYSFDFLSVDYTEKTILIRPGNWNLVQDLIIPEGFTLIAGAWTQINLKNSSRIISYSPLNFVGSEESPIKITSSDKTGKGILVLASGKRSYLKNVIISNSLVTFYESPIFISRSQFLGNTSDDDTVHILRSEFEISDSLFKDNFSDGLDVDFGQGKIVRTSFINVGGDALDFSGSNINIEDVYIKNAGDKGISAGEDSQIEIENLEITDSNICLAAKDLSELTADDVTIDNCKTVGITVFQKKPEFGPGMVIITNLQIKNTSPEFLVEKGSSLKVDGKDIKAEEINLKDKFYNQ